MVSYTDRSRVLTVALGVFKSQTPQTGPDWSGLMAATLVAALPMIVLFMLFAEADRQLHRLQRDQVRSPMITFRQRHPHRRGRLVLTAAALAACSSTTGSSANGTIEYWLWDSAQQPGYQKCADAFAKANPGLKIHISQYGWDDYWSKLTAGFIADTAPDVFTDHLSKFAAVRRSKVLRPLDDLGPTSGHQGRRLPAGPGGSLEGPGRQAVRRTRRTGTRSRSSTTTTRSRRPASIPPQLENLTWNPQDGGTFEKLVAHLTVDDKGVRGDEPGFDKSQRQDARPRLRRLRRRWLGPDPVVGVHRQRGLAGTDKNPWGTKFNLDQPALQDTLSWYFGLVQKGYMPSYEEIGGANAIGTDKQIQSGTAAMGLSGSWMISSFTKLTDSAGKKLDIGLAPTPIGPSGKRASMFNGLADSVTTLSKQPENAAKWVAFLSGAECQNIIGQSGVVFPARPAGTQLAIAYNKSERKLDVTPFTRQVVDKTTFLFPVTTNAADIAALMAPRFDAVYIGSSPVSSLTKLNTQLDELFKVVG